MCAEAHHHGLRIRHRLSREVAASGSTGTRRFHPLSAFHLSGFLVLRWQYDKRDEAIKKTRKRLVRPASPLSMAAGRSRPMDLFHPTRQRIQDEGVAEGGGETLWA